MYERGSFHAPSPAVDITIFLTFVNLNGKKLDLKLLRHIYTYIQIYICVCVHVYMCVQIYTKDKGYLKKKYKVDSRIQTEMLRNNGRWAKRSIDNLKKFRHKMEKQKRKWKTRGLWCHKFRWFFTLSPNLCRSKEPAEEEPLTTQIRKDWQFPRPCKEPGARCSRRSHERCPFSYHQEQKRRRPVWFWWWETREIPFRVSAVSLPWARPSAERHRVWGRFEEHGGGSIVTVGTVRCANRRNRTAERYEAEDQPARILRSATEARESRFSLA